MSDRSQKIAIVTGGASGIGRSICLRLARDGAEVAIFDLNLGGAEQVAQEVGTLGRRALALHVDVADPDRVSAAVAEVRQRLGRVQILVNDAGIGEFALLGDMDVNRWDRMLRVHLYGTFHCTKAVVPDMVAGAWGRLVNIASVAGLNGGGAGLSHYAAAKAGIIGFTKAMAHELGPSGITVNAIAPGLIDTPILKKSAMPSATIQATAKRVPVRRIGAPEDIAAACAYLTSDDASFCTGQVISPNGGGYL